MENIREIFAIEKWLYTETETLGDTTGMVKKHFKTTDNNNRPCTITTWINVNNGNGFEVREHELKMSDDSHIKP